MFSLFALNPGEFSFFVWFIEADEDTALTFAYLHSVWEYDSVVVRTGLDSELQEMNQEVGVWSTMTL